MKITAHSHAYEVDDIRVDLAEPVNGTAGEQNEFLQLSFKALGLLDRNDDVRGAAREAARAAIVKRILEQLASKRPEWEGRDLARKRDTLREALLGPARLRRKENGRLPSVLPEEERALAAARQVQLEAELRQHLRSLAPHEREAALLGAAAADDVDFMLAVERIPPTLQLFDEQSLDQARQLHARTREPVQYAEMEALDRAVVVMQGNVQTTLRAVERLIGAPIDDPIRTVAEGGDPSAMEPLRAQ